MKRKIKRKRKICVVTGTRAEYGLLKPTMQAVQKSKNLSLQVLCVGMHLAPEFGRTLKEIKQDGFDIAGLVKMTAKEDTEKAMAQSIGKGVVAAVDVFNKIKPDVVVVLGDRIEAFAAAIAASYMNIALAHIHGGDSPKSGLDEYARHAITKLSHIHFPATKKSAERIKKLGEDSWRIFIVGAPGLDSVLNEKLFSSKEIAKKYNLDLSKPFVLAVQHPVTTDVKNAAKQIKETMEAVRELGLQTIVIYPNADAGGRRMIKVIERYRKYPLIKIYKNIIHKDYLSLMKIARVLVGNSSSGIIESPSFHLPVVNVGQRQEGRERAGNVIDAGYNKNGIKKAVLKAVYDKKFREKLKKIKNFYGSGKAGRKIVEILTKINLDKKLFQKRITY